MSNRPDINHVQYIPDREQVVQERRSLVVEQEPGLIFEPVQKEGGESVVDYVIFEGRECVLKVSKIGVGMSKERAAFLDLQGFADIPELIKDYVHQNVAIALLVERFNGIPFQEFLEAHPERALLFFQNLRKAINGFHGRGFGVPGDWLKPGNVLATVDETCGFVDLGAVEKPNNPYSLLRTIDSDNRRFRSVVGDFLDTRGLRRKIKRKLEKFWLEDKTLNPS